MRILLTFLSFQFYLNCFSQNTDKQIEKDKRKIERIKTTIVGIDTSIHFSNTVKLPFSNIRVWDARLDTTLFSIIAYQYPLAFKAIHFEKANFKGGAGKGFSFFLNNYFTKNFDSTKGEIVCVIKKLLLNKKDTSLYDNQSLKRLYYIQTDIECFYHFDSLYYPAIKLDTIISKECIAKDLNLKEFLAEPMVALATKISRVNIERIVKRKYYTA